MKTNKLVLVRHGQSIWNEKNLFTGWKDIGLTKKGINEAKSVGEQIKRIGTKFDAMYTSSLVRAQKTGEIILECILQKEIEIISDQLWRINWA